MIYMTQEAQRNPSEINSRTDKKCTLSHVHSSTMKSQKEHLQTSSLKKRHIKQTETKILFTVFVTIQPEHNRHIQNVEQRMIRAKMLTP